MTVHPAADATSWPDDALLDADQVASYLGVHVQTGEA